jgi:hypothetical protein
MGGVCECVGRGGRSGEGIGEVLSRGLPHSYLGSPFLGDPLIQKSNSQSLHPQSSQEILHIFL